MFNYTAIVSKVKCDECAQECECFECSLCKNGNCIIEIIEPCIFDTLTSMFDAITKEINKIENKSYGNGMGNRLTEVKKYLNECCKAKVKLKLKLAQIQGQGRGQGQGQLGLKIVIEIISCHE